MRSSKVIVKGFAPRFLIIAVVALSAGCAEPVPPVPRETATLRALPQLSEAEAARLVSLQWRPASSSTAERQILISVPDLRCQDIVGTRTESSPAAVTITVLGRPVTCRAAPAEAVALVELPEPIGRRSLLHAPVATARTSAPG